MDSSFDPVSLITETRFNRVNALLVVDRLARAAPLDLSLESKKALKGAKDARNVLERARQERATQSPQRLRPYVVRFNTAWSGISDVLAAVAALPVEIAGNKPARAQKLRDLLFPEAGAPMLRTDAETAYVEASDRLARVAEGEPARELVAIVGREHVEAVQKMTAELGEALGVGETVRTAPSSTAMQDALREVSRRVHLYARRLLAELDDDDEASVERFQRALAPLAEHKASLRGGASDDGEDDDAADPVVTPATPAAPVATPTPERA